MKNTLIIILCLWSFINEVQGQDLIPDKKNSLYLQFGLERGAFKDINFSPLNYSSKGYGFNVGYERNTIKNNLFQVSLRPIIGSLNSPRSEYFKTSRYAGDFSVGYLKSIALAKNHVKLHVGGQYNSFIDFISYSGTEAVSFFALHSLDFKTRFSVSLSDKHEIKTSISLPIFGLFARPPYTGWDKFIVERADNPIPVFFKGKWTSWNDFQVANLQIEYDYHLSNSWNLSLAYLFKYYSTDLLDDVINVNQQLLIGTSYNF